MDETPGCPSCSHTEAEKVRFTWWGGVLGPSLLAHVRCLQCGAEYNGRTGRPNTTAIAIYFVAVLTIVGGISLMFALGGH